MKIFPHFEGFFVLALAALCCPRKCHGIVKSAAFALPGTIWRPRLRFEGGLGDHRGNCNSAGFNDVKTGCTGRGPRLWRGFDGCIAVRGGSLHASTSGEDAAAEDSSVRTVSATAISSSYHLIWSPGFRKKMVLTTAALLALRWAAASRGIELPGVLHSILHPAACHHTAAAAATAPSATSPASSFVEKLARLVVLPLLSSACCAVQLALNALFAGAGCAGFNSYLGPLRPYFLSVMLVSAATSPSRAAKAADLVVWAVALLPEAVHARNGRLARRQGPVGSGGGGGSSEEVGDGAATDRDKDAFAAGTATLELTIPGMGCAACVQKIDSSVRSCTPRMGRVLRSSSWLTDEPKGGKAQVVLAAESEEGMNKLVADVISAVKSAGFQCEVESLGS